MEPYQHTVAGTEESRGHFAAAARSMQIVGGALLMGCVAFAMVALFLKGISNEIYEGAGVLTYMGMGMGCIMFVNSFVVPMMIGRRQGNSVDEWTGIFRSKTIVGMALCEGAIFINLIAYIVNAQLINLGIALVLVTRLMMQVPTAGGVESWVSDRMRSVKQEF